MTEVRVLNASRILLLVTADAEPIGPAGRRGSQVSSEMTTRSSTKNAEPHREHCRDGVRRCLWRARPLVRSGGEELGQFGIEVEKVAFGFERHEGEHPCD